MSADPVQPAAVFCLDLASRRWLGTPDDPDDVHDLDLHGTVDLTIGGVDVLNRTDGEWSVSTAALMLLRTVSEDFTPDPGGCEQLIPCCGHDILYDKHGRVMPLTCPNGVTFSVRHADAREVEISGVRRLGGDGGTTLVEGPVRVPLRDYRRSIAAFAAAVKNVFDTAAPKRPEEAGFLTTRESFDDFWTEYAGHLNSALAADQ